ncbi:MAG: DUF1926 domain-containing protein [Firmicutes bacterium]|nr:DUF1926 domain-containing protein [Bacillota bacterium]
MKGKIHLILALHNHQPEGNLPEVFARTYAAAYEPFLGMLERFPKIKVVQHYSGILLRWLAEQRPAFLDRLRKLLAAGQLELMGGAFYEPILVMIPDEDKIGQIKKLSRFLRENFQVDAAGAWLAERIWEPQLAASLAGAGIKYTVLDDAVFKKAGFTEEQTMHYYLTEEGGEKLYLFPISEKLRYLIPFADPKETLDYLADAATTQGDRVVVLADDGEKFGSWPGTAKHVYEKKWLEKFFTLLSENSDWLVVTTFSEFLHSRPPAGLVYLPAGSYREMEEWSGGSWRNFFTRYPESNQLHKKMLHVREKIQLLPEGPQKKKAQEYLWAGQCNCAYWHGVFGGLYLNFLRSAIYSRLIAAEELADRVLHPKEPWLAVEQKDFDYDGREEVIVSGSELNFVLAPAAGGSLLELDFKPRRFNLLDVLTRRKEPYHCDLYERAQGLCETEEARSIHHITRVKEAGLERFLVYDAYRRLSLLDHFYPPGTVLDSPDAAQAEAGDFVCGTYELKQLAADKKASLLLERQGRVSLRARHYSVTVRKALSYLPQSGEISFDYELQNMGKEPLGIIFAVEFNLTFLAGKAADRYYHAPGQKLIERNIASRGVLAQVNRFGLVDEWLGLAAMFRFDRPATVWRMPLETVSQSEAGMERVYQGSSLFFSWEIKLLPDTVWAVTFTQSLEELIREANR